MYDDKMKSSEPYVAGFAAGKTCPSHIRKLSRQGLLAVFEWMASQVYPNADYAYIQGCFDGLNYSPYATSK